MKNKRDMLKEENKENKKRPLINWLEEKRIWKRENNKFCLEFKIGDKPTEKLKEPVKMKIGKMLMNMRKRFMKQLGTLMFLMLMLKSVKLIKICCRSCKTGIFQNKLKKNQKQRQFYHLQEKEHLLIWFNTNLTQATIKMVIKWMPKASNQIKVV